jgi:LuxR family maltose regulon positive regulatory protein
MIDVLLPGGAALRLWRRRGARTEARERAAPLPTRILVDAKTHVPEPRPEWILRSSLIHTLTDSRNVRLVLVSAPAGFGKTTLAAEWAASQDEDRPFAWVLLDEVDNDPVSLWTTVVASLNDALTGLDEDNLTGALQNETPDVDRALLPRLLNALAARHEPVVLVLDDYHVLHEPACHRQIEAFIDRLPSSVQLTLISRTAPILPLGRYRASGDILEFGMGDLRFTREEAALFVRRISGIRLTDSDLDILLERAEGWPAAVYLAALSLRESSDLAGFVRDFAGTNRLVIDYLSQEVLRPLPEEIRRFLFRMSIPDRMTAALGDAVTGTPNTADLLDYLERSNLFLVPLDDSRRWYRFHHLFRDVLRGELARSEPDIVPVLHRRAGRWFADQGMVGDAIGHALAGGDRDFAVALLTRHWFKYVNVGRLATVRSWIESIGSARMGREPVTAICEAWVMALSGDRQATRHWLEVAQELPHEGSLPDGSPSVRFAVELIRALFGFDGVPELLRSAETAVALEPDSTSRWYALARTVLGQGRYLSGDADGAIGPLEEAAQNSAAVLTCRILALSILSLSLDELGRTAQAAQHARTAVELVERAELTESATVTLASTALGAVLAREGRYEEARRRLEHVLTIRRRIVGLTPWPTLSTLIVLAEMSLDSGDQAAARAVLDEARDLVAAEADSGDHLRTRIARLEQRLTGPSRRNPLSEPLTEREEAVLRLLRGDLSLREIGRELHVTSNTVKTHTRAIYRKLGVSSREEAIRRARDLGLL